MQRVHRLTEPTALEMPNGFDGSGVPCADAAGPARKSARRRHRHALPGLAPTSLIVSVEAVAAQGDEEGIGDWLVWGTAGNRLIMFTVEPGAGAEMMHAVAVGETATAIVEPWQLVLERLD